MHARILVLLFLALPAHGAPVPPRDAPSEILDLHYGEALYQFYRGSRFTAAVHLLAAQKRGHMLAHGSEPDILLGGLYLAYGMPDDAEAVFEALLHRDAQPDRHERAWMQLARVRYRYGRPDAALAALGRIGDDAPDGGVERQVLSGLIRLQQGENGMARDALGRVQDDDEWSRYGRYNKAIAQLRTDQVDAALQTLEAVGSIDAGTPEMKALRDRANLARGFLLIESDRPEQGRRALERIRTSAPDTNLALLGVGWASLRHNDARGALAPWRMLASRDARDPAVLEAMLAVPYAYSLLGDDLQSLDNYRRGIDRYRDEYRRTEQAIDAIGNGRLPEALSAMPDAPGDGDPALSLLPLLLTENRFRAGWNDYQSMAFLRENLDEWRAKIGVYRVALAEHRTAYRRNQPAAAAQRTADAVHALRQAHDRLESPSETHAGEDALSVNAALARAERRQSRIASSLRSVPGRFDRFEDTIRLLEMQVDEQLARASRLQAAQAAQLEGMAIALLEQRKQRLNDYLKQARIGVATVLDRSIPTAGGIR